MPIIDDFYLPADFTLIYASADVGKEYVPNRLISLCDKEANSVLARIKAEGSTGLPLTLDDPDSEYFCRWDYPHRGVE
jgi:hypothetical protein